MKYANAMNQMRLETVAIIRIMFRMYVFMVNALFEFSELQDGCKSPFYFSGEFYIPAASALSFLRYSFHHASRLRFSSPDIRSAGMLMVTTVPCSGLLRLRIFDVSMGTGSSYFSFLMNSVAKSSASQTVLSAVMSS